MKYDWLLFDADGTLFDFEKAESEALAGTFAAYGYPFNGRTTALYHDVNSQIWREFEQGVISQDALRSERFARLFERLNLDSDPHKFSDLYEQNLGMGSYLLPGAEELLAELNGHFQLLLITNGITNVQRPRLAGSTIKDTFSQVIISGEVGFAKPDPQIFDAAFAAMGYPPKKHCLIIGDSLSSDIRGGLNYGIDTCWYNPNSQSAEPSLLPTYEINQLGQILGIVFS